MSGTRVLLTHTPRMREQHYGKRSLAELEALVQVTLHQGEEELTPEGLIAVAVDVDFIVVDEAALSAVLVEGRIADTVVEAGHAADRMPSPEVAWLPSVIATPHLGGLAPPAIEARALDAVGQVRAILAGEIPRGAANPDARSHFPRVGVA